MSHFHKEINHLLERVRMMAAHVERQVDSSIQAILERNVEIANRVIGEDRLTDHFEIEVDETAVRLLACYQPMAIDLRVIINVSKISGTLERIGDMAVNNARGALHVNAHPPRPPFGDVGRLTQLSREMIHDAILAFARSDTRLAREICVRDDVVDALKDELQQALIALMRENPDYVNPAVSMLLVVRNLERMGDLATNISEDVVHMVEGVIIKHHHEEELREQA